MTTIPAWSATLIPATAVVAVAMSASVTRPAADIGWTGAEAGAGVDSTEGADGADGGLEAAAVEAAAGAEDRLAVLWSAAAGELADDAKAVEVTVAAPCPADEQPASSTTVPRATAVAAGK